MKEDKTRHTVRAEREVWSMVEKHYYKDNCTKKSEYIEKAIRFYSGYLDAAGYIKYIATRDGVEMIGPEGYLEYMATRSGSHGLFSGQPVTDLNTVLKEAERHTGPVWTLIYPLRREDAARLGYDSAASWRDLIKSHQVELATAMKIPPEQFRWYAAYHDADTHPHIHMTVWSADPKQGFLTPEGIKAMRSVLTNSIFQDELYSLYQQKDISYKELTEQARTSMRELARQMENTVCDSPAIETQMLQLSRELKNVSGKKVYGYLKKPLKEQVNAIVDELAKMPQVAECYKIWNRLRDELESYYKDKPRQHLPLSQQKEFKAIKNMVIREVENLRLGVVTFEARGCRMSRRTVPGSATPTPRTRTNTPQWSCWNAGGRIMTQPPPHISWASSISPARVSQKIQPKRSSTSPTPQNRVMLRPSIS